MADPTGAAPPIRVLLADDHALLREGLRLLIDAEPDMTVIGQAANGIEVCALAVASSPDVVVMDLSMPDGPGIEATIRLRRECPTVRIVGLSRHSAPGYVRRLFGAGATGYVVKRSSAAELVQAVRVVAAGGTYLDSVVTPLLAHDGHSGGSADPGWREATLTNREADVLQQIARGRSTKEIAATLGISVKTVEYHKARSTAKLGLRSRADIVRYAIGQRWMEE